MSGQEARQFLQQCIERLGGGRTSHDVLGGRGEVPARLASIEWQGDEPGHRDATCADEGPPRAPRRYASSEEVSRSTRGTDMLGCISLLPHQVMGARLLQQVLVRHGGALLADEVGLGKTFTALAVARGMGRLLVVAPAALREMWTDACQRAAVRADFASYERLSSGRHSTEPRWDVVIVDEAHHARTPSTRRFRALATMTRGARVLLLTATPVHNRSRDLRVLLSLFLGSAAESLDEAAISALIVRRRSGDVERPLPSLAPVVQHPIPRADGVLQAVQSLPPPLPPSDGGVAQALVALQLTRAWCSSDAALLAAIRRRLTVAAALEQSLEAGRLPARRDLATWTADVDGSVQLAFPELVAAPAAVSSISEALAVVRAHAAALRALRARARGDESRDGARFTTLAQVLASHDGQQVVVFTHSAETAEAAFAALRGRFRLALLTGRGASLASGPVARTAVLEAFAPTGVLHPTSARRADALRIDVLVATDVLSEGVDLQRASVVVHLDLPWTVARIEQRMGRLRRMGSPHSEVQAHFISPPVGVAELEATLVHLTRKARLAGALLGPSTVLGDADQWRSILPRISGPSTASAREAICDALRLLRHRAGDADHSPSRAPDGVTPTPFAVGSAASDGSRTETTSPTTGPQSVAAVLHGVPAVRWFILQGREPRTVALVTLSGTPHLVVASARDLTIDPIAVIAELSRLCEDVLPSVPLAPETGAILRRAVGAPPATPAHATRERGAIPTPAPREQEHPPTDHAFGQTAMRGPSEACDHAAPRDPSAVDAARLGEASLAEPCEQRVHHWCRSRCATQHLVSTGTDNSRSHRSVLHALDAIPARAPRSRRAHLAAAIATGRRLVLAQHGAGAELLLEQLAQSFPRPPAGTAQVEHWLEQMIALLGPPAHAMGHRESSAEASEDTSAASIELEGMLTFLPAPRRS